MTYDAQNIHRVAASYAELDHEFLVKAINASIHSGCVYTPEESYLAADYLGCKRLKDAFAERLELPLTPPPGGASSPGAATRSANHHNAQKRR